MVLKDFLSVLKRMTIPFGVASTTFLFTSFEKAKAASIFEIKGPITSLATKDELGKLEEFKGLFENLQMISDGVLKGIEWLKHLPEHIAELSVYLLTKIYELLMLVLQTPLFIFNNTYIQDATILFSSVSVLLVTLLTIYEGMKMMMRKRHTDLKIISKRFFVAALGAGMAPFLFEKSFELINILTSSIAKIGSSGFKMNDPTSAFMPFNNPSAFDWFNTIALIGFDFMLLATVIPILLQNGRRFFDLMCLAAITPLALSCWVFKEQKYLFDKWWFNVKRLGSTPIIYSIFICILGLFIFGTQNVMSGGGLLIKMIIIVGGLQRMANIPSFVKSRVDSGPGIDESIGSGIKKFKNAYDTITLKKVKDHLKPAAALYKKKQ